MAYLPLGRNRVWCHDRFEFSQHLPPEPLVPHGEPPPLIVAEPQTLLTVQFSQDAILFLQVVDDRPLFLVHSTGEHHEERLTAYVA